MTWLHDFSGLSWGSTIVISTVIVRMMILPLVVHQAHTIATLENVTNSFEERKKEIHKIVDREALTRNFNTAKMKKVYRHAVRREWQKVIIENNCHPMKISLLAIIQMPTWVVMSTTLRNLVYQLPNSDDKAEVISNQLSVEGFFWFQDLTLPDSTWMLPITLGLTNLLIIQIQQMMRVKKPTKIGMFMVNVFRVFSIIMIPVAAHVPSVISFYWLSSSLFGFAQNVILQSPSVKRFFKIPVTPSASLQPPIAVLTRKLKGIFMFLKY